MNNRIIENPIKFQAIGARNDDPTRKMTKCHRGEKTKIDVDTFDGYALRNISFEGVAYTREDALRLSDFFKVHSQCLKSENDAFFFKQSFRSIT